MSNEVDPNFDPDSPDNSLAPTDTPYVGVSPEYKNAANETEVPLSSENERLAEMEQRAADYDEQAKVKSVDFGQQKPVGVVVDPDTGEPTVGNPDEHGVKTFQQYHEERMAALRGEPVPTPTDDATTGNADTQKGAATGDQEDAAVREYADERTHEQLVAEAEAAGLPHSGTKYELAERILSA